MGNNSAPVLGQQAQLVIGVNQKLQELGIDGTIRLPRIVVIGDQSTGKSSLIEAISTITVPKAIGTCTKCPIAINLSNGESPTSPWTCSVYTEEKYYYDHDLRQKKVSKKTPLGPWHEAETVKLSLIEKTQDPSRLTTLIEQAQARLLTATGEFGTTTGTATQSTEGFSPNSIRIDVSCGDWPNLSFVDLPGVIQIVQRGQPNYYVDLVQSLARQYARDENNVIMLTLPMNYDVHNSQAYSIVQHERAQSRTIAVFTKADRARPEEQRDCIGKYFDDETEEEFGHGYRIVMLAEPTKEDKRTRDQMEEEFFSRDPWNNVSDDTRNCFGVGNLVMAIRKILFDDTKKALPGNLGKISRRIADIEQQISAMPEPPDAVELPYQLQGQIYKLDVLVRALFTSMQAVSGMNSRGKLMKLMKTFCDRIRNDHPTMIIKTDAESSRLEKAELGIREGSSCEPVSLDTDTEHTISASSPTKKAAGTARRQKFQLEDIRKRNHNRYQSSIPGEIEPAAVDEMHRLSVQHWNVSLDEFLSDTGRLVLQEVTLTMETIFCQENALQRKLASLIKEYLDTVISEEWENLKKLCQAEQQYPLTFNKQAIKAIETENLQVKRQRRQEARLQLEVAELKVRTGKTRVKEPATSELGPDPWDVEVQMAAKARAYYVVAASRFSDTICQGVLAHLVPRLHDPMMEFLSYNLGLDDITANRVKIVTLMAEDPAREALRTRLLNELTRLREGRTYISTVLHTMGGTADRVAHIDQGAFAIDMPVIDNDNIAFFRNETSVFNTSNKRKAGFDDFDNGSPTKRLQPQENPFVPVLDFSNIMEHTRLATRSRSADIGN